MLTRRGGVDGSPGAVPSWLRDGLGRCAGLRAGVVAALCLAEDGLGLAVGEAQQRLRGVAEHEGVGEQAQPCLGFEDADELSLDRIAATSPTSAPAGTRISAR